MQGLSTIKLLRIPFSIFLSPLYFFALSQVEYIDQGKAFLVFFILHLLIYPASNGYNSFMDRDTGPIGGLENPPPASRTLYHTTIFLDLLAIGLSFIIHPVFGCLVPIYIAASKAYSYRKLRLKKYPVIGYLTVIIFQGAFTFWLVWFGCQVNPDTHTLPLHGMLISALLIGGFYPLTQIYQHKQDLDDGVKTLSYKLGLRGTFLFSAFFYILAWLSMAQFFILKNQIDRLILVSIFFIPILVYFIIWWNLVWRDPSQASYKNTMRMNWIAAICTNLAFITLLIWNNIE